MLRWRYLNQKDQLMKIKTIFICTDLLFTLHVSSTRDALADLDKLLKYTSFELKLPPDQVGWILFDESMF